MPKNINDTKFYTEKYFEFLITDFQFDKIPDYYVAYEYHIAFQKGKIEINITCEADGTSLPWVTLRNFKRTRKIGNKRYPENFSLTEIEFPDDLKKMYRSRSERYISSDTAFDYEQNGRQELEMVLKQNAEIIKRHSKILSGDLDVFPKKKYSKVFPMNAEISIRQDDGTYKVVCINESNPAMKIWKWIRSWFKRRTATNKALGKSAA